MTQTLAPSTTPLNAQDRCDRCGAQAYVRVALPVGELHFCAHHWSQHGDALRGQAVEIQDDTHLLKG